MRSKRLNQKAEINIVPFLDVLLVLLLVFMATAPVLTQSVQVNLPKEENAKANKNQNNQIIILEIASLKNYKLKSKGEYLKVHKINLTEQEVVNLASQILKKQPKAVFLVAGDKSAPYDAIIKGIALLKKAGVTQVGLMTE